MNKGAEQNGTSVLEQRRERAQTQDMEEMMGRWNVAVADRRSDSPARRKNKGAQRGIATRKRESDVLGKRLKAPGWNVEEFLGASLFGFEGPMNFDS